MKFEGLNKYFKGDKVIWIIMVLLCVLSLLVVYSSTGSLAYRRYGGNTQHFLVKQGAFLIIGLVVAWLVHTVHYKWFKLLAMPAMLISIPLLLVTLVSGVNLNAASRWLEVPGLGISFQTSDFAKIALIMYVAKVLSKKQKNIKDFKEAFVPIVLPVGLTCALILPANFSTAALLGLTCLILMFVGRVSIKHLLGLLGLAAVFVTLFIVVSLNSDEGSRAHTWKRRVESFTGSGDSDSNFQSEQSKIAIATGGVFGKGPGQSTQRNILPHPYSDFIFAIIVEEFGLIGGVFVLMFYLIILYRVGIIVRKEQHSFPAFLTFGLALLMLMQAVVNMAVAVNLIPVTGQTLPLVSMGGTSLIITCAAFGMILSVSRVQNKKELFDGEEPVKDNS